MEQPIRNLPAEPGLSSAMTIYLKTQKDFVHSLDKCHPLALQERNCIDASSKLTGELIKPEILPSIKSKELFNVFKLYKDCMTFVEIQHRAFLDKYMKIYTNSDNVEKIITEDQQKIKKTEEQYKTASADYKKFYNTSDPIAKNNIKSKYDSDLNIYLESKERTTNELKKSEVEKIELIAVIF